ncbi:DsbA family protein [Patescibacteria group bacterium]|nr:DsbA family protein [Patescibacteria group bacterium]MBU1754759.1 DsbA family protein [Patescibacteria group bacterium]
MNIQNWFLPGAILGAGLILAISIFVVRTTTDIAIPKGDPEVVRPVSPDDHVFGSPEAPIKVITYSDIDCKACKKFQQTMAQVMTEYGPSGNVAWVFRHLPLIDIHAYAKSHAEAAECVASIGGEDAFWRFIDLLQAIAPNDNEFIPDGYPVVLEQLGISETEFRSCMIDHTFAKRVEADFGNALDTGANSAPYVVLVIKGEKPITIEGAPTYDIMKRLLDDKIAGLK